MSNFKKFIPALALVVALSPFAASAVSHNVAGKGAHLNSTVISSQVAANSQGRPGDFKPAAANQTAANSKGRPAEFNSVTNQVAANSKGRPAEFNTANQVAENSKGRPAEYNPAQANQTAANSKGRPAEFTTTVELG